MRTAEKVICFGEIMMRLNTPSSKRFLQTTAWEIFYGGSEANVSVLLAQLGVPSAFVSRLPANDLGQAALEAVRHHGVDVSPVVRGDDRLGLYFTETSNTLRPSRVIYDRADSAFARLKPGMIPWESIFSSASWFHWSGIAAAVSESAAEVCLEAVTAARKAGVKISADLNYRSTLWKWGKHPAHVMPELLSHCDLLTGDIDTAEIYFGIKSDKSLARNDALIACGKQLKEKIEGLELLAMSFRDISDTGVQRYSGVLLAPDKMYTSAIHEFGNTVERIGSGDAFMGGLIYGMIQNRKPQEIIDFAVAAGTLKHSIPGEFTIVSKEEIENFLHNGNARGKIIR